MTWSYIPNIDRGPYPVMSSCATQNSKEEYKGKPDKANAKIAKQKKTAFVIRTGFQATDKNSRLIRE